ncbi:hypothetical protein JT359_09090, partial [Candidatus Poribacteria bacterium]|nr:hypothetical protein [Candidatus Poribacteria bacterium]
ALYINTTAENPVHTKKEFTKNARFVFMRYDVDTLESRRDGMFMENSKQIFLSPVGTECL